MHTSTIQVSQSDMARGQREESYARALQEWRAGTISDADWEFMRQSDPDFRAWLWKMGVT